MLEEEQDRKIIISTNIDSSVAGSVIEFIDSVNEYDRRMMSELKLYEPEPITMIINSVGGEAYAGFAIIGAMEMSETPIITVGLGLVASVALGIFVSGDYKIAHRLARMMYHSVSYGQEGKIRDHEEYHNEAKLIQSMYNDLFEDTKLTTELMSDVIKNKSDYYFSGEEAVELGIADSLAKKADKFFSFVKKDEEEAIESE